MSKFKIVAEKILDPQSKEEPKWIIIDKLFIYNNQSVSEEDFHKLLKEELNG